MKKYVLYNPNKQTSRLIGSKQPIDITIGSEFKAETTSNDGVKPEFDSYKSSHVVEIDIENGKVSSAKYVDLCMQHLPIGKNVSDRSSQRGRTLKEINHLSTAVIIRAVDSYTNTFKQDDYVMVMGSVPKPHHMKEAELHILDEDDARTPIAKALVWVAQHAQSMAASYSRDQHVIMSVVKSQDVCEATNPGEWFYTGGTKEGRVLMSFDEFGNIKEPESKTAELAR